MLTSATSFALLLRLIIQVPVAVGLEISSVPQIYPQKNFVVVDAHTDLVLGCRGAEPIRWAFHDDVNGLHYHSAQKYITYINNTIDLEYKFGTILTIYNVSHINVGYYYCHGEKTDFNTPRRSNRIYVFVNDDNNLSIITSGNYRYYSYHWLSVLPCRPTSPDINVTLTCDDGFSMSVIPNNYSEIQREELYSVRFHPFDGFTAQGQVPVTFRNCSCYFRREKRIFSLKVETNYDSNLHYIEHPVIDGSDTVNVGNNITLQCSSLVQQYRPEYKHGLQWDVPSGGNYAITNHYTMKLKHNKLYISTLTIKNLSSEDEGYYRCSISRYTHWNTHKYVAVLDKQVSQNPPRIFSPGLDQDEIQVNSGENVTLRCEGSRPVTWSWDKHGLFYYRYNYKKYIITNLNNGLYSSDLYITQINYIDTGFYYCHEKDSAKDHPLYLDKIFIFVKDKKYLYLPQDKEQYFAYEFDNVTVPCRPTSRDVRVTLSIQRSESAGKIDPVIHAYDPRKGFTVQMTQPGDFTVTCKFDTYTAISTLELNYHIGPINSEPLIKGPREDFVFEGDTLELFCIVAVLHNVADDALHWKNPNNSRLIDRTPERINVYGGKVLISKLFIYNMKNKDEGRYTCYLPYNNATTSKFISVYDKFEVKPHIENLTFHYAYVGQPLVLQCGVNVSHNVDFNMSWTAPNATEMHLININTEYILKVRHIKGQIILKIDNVTYENEGNYSCYVSDLTNKRKKITKYIQVKRGKAPMMRVAHNYINNPEEINVLINETAKLTCLAEGDPKPTITWMKGSIRVQKYDRRFGFSADNSELTILLVQKLDAGLYTCIARNPHGQDSRVVSLRVKSVSFSGAMIVCIIVLTIAVIAVAVAFAKFEYKKKRRRRALLEDGFDNFKFGEAEQEALSGYDTKWEIPRNKIKLGHNLGSGYFGLVVEATVSNFFDGWPVKTVAVKMLQYKCDITALHSLLSELQILAHLENHVNLINLLGACTENIVERSLLVVIEYCEYGSLRSYLLENRSHFVDLIDPDTEQITDVEDAEARSRANGPVTTLDLVRWALQVARGMEFLASRKVVHGDLAARNILLAENYVVKISDFGLSRNLNSSDYYRKRSQCLLPVKWMALESIRDKTFSTWSDVWSFGVVLWELFSLARTPYAELEPDFCFYRKLESGYRLDQPRYSTREIYQVMRECWCAQPQHRPTFPLLVHTLDDLLQEVHTRCIRSHHDYVNISGECPSAASIRCNDNKAEQEQFALDDLTATSTDSNTYLYN